MILKDILAFGIVLYAVLDRFDLRVARVRSINCRASAQPVVLLQPNFRGRGQILSDRE